MSLSFKITAYSAPLCSRRLVSGEFLRTSISRVSARNLRNFFAIQSNHRHLRSINSNSNNAAAADDYSENHEDEGSGEKSDGREGLPSSKEILKRLKRYGISGILSYGLLNTAYYFTTFLLVWFYVAPAPRRMGYAAAAERFIKVIAMVWAGSQVTKLIRAGGALTLAPIVDRGLSWFTTKFKFESQGKAFMAIIVLCFGLAMMLFFVVTLLWA
ncbi:hypothetical protein SLE2022_066750 [Rubroshorea leprosula]